MKFHEMTAPQLRQVPRDSTMVLAPIAACEQHSRHLPTFTDTILVTAVAEGMEQRLPREVLLLPTLWLGASSHHLPLGGTLSAEVDTHITMLCDLLTPLLEDGYQRVLLLNGHGGNIDTLHVALRRLQPRYRGWSPPGAREIIDRAVFSATIDTRHAGGSPRLRHGGRRGEALSFPFSFRRACQCLPRFC